MKFNDNGEIIEATKTELRHMYDKNLIWSKFNYGERLSFEMSLSIFEARGGKIINEPAVTPVISVKPFKYTPPPYVIHDDPDDPDEYRPDSTVY